MASLYAISRFTSGGKAHRRAILEGFIQYVVRRQFYAQVYHLTSLFYANPIVEPFDAGLGGWNAGVKGLFQAF